MKKKLSPRWQRLKVFADWVDEKNIPLHAAYTGFFIVLAIFPALMLLLGFLRYTGLQVQTLTDLVADVVPAALMPIAKRLILSAYQNTSGMVLSISAVTALWSSSSGMYGLLRGMNSIYGVRESRSWLRTRLYSMLYTLGFLAVLILSLFVDVFGEKLLSYWPAKWAPGMVQDMLDLHFFVLLGLETFLFAAMYTVLPNRNNKFIESLPGAMLAAVGWQIFSDLYSVYVEHFTGYSNIYGSVYAVAVSMLWLYCCICILFYGGVLNAFLQDADGKFSHL